MDIPYLDVIKSRGIKTPFTDADFHIEQGGINTAGGMEIEFGDSETMIELVHMIAKREGVGDLLAEGTRIMAQRLGHNSERFAMNVKGLELPAYDSRAAKITGLAFATANRGGDHVTAYVQGPTFLASPFLVVEESEIEDPLQENPQEAKVVKDMEDAPIVKR